MDWTNLLWLGAFIALFLFMMRSCRAGGCGMSSRRRDAHDEGSYKAHDELKRVA